MDGDKAADVLMELDEEDRHKLLKELPNELIAKRFVDNMETDDAVDLMREVGRGYPRGDPFAYRGRRAGR